MVRATQEGRRIQMRGAAQGVGVRRWICRAAIWSGVTGRVRRDARGVTIDAFGDLPSLERFERFLHTTMPPAAHIVDYESRGIEAEPVGHFTIVTDGQVADEGALPEEMASSSCHCSRLEDPCGFRA